MTDYAQYVEKKVVLVYNLDKPNDKGEGTEEQEGTVVAATAEALMFRPKGKTASTIIEVSKIESIDYAEGGSKKLARRTLKLVEFGQARAHLLERHGLTLTEVNGLSEKDAFERHNGIDHEASDLGHVHKAKDEAAAPANASASDED